MSWRVELLEALRSRLVLVPGIEAWQIVYANREPDTKPTPTSQWIAESINATSSEDAAIGQAIRWREIVGTWQLLLNVPVDAGVRTALEFSDALEVQFITSLLALADGTPLRIVATFVGTPRPATSDDPWVRIPVVFTFKVTTHT